LIEEFFRHADAARHRHRRSAPHLPRRTDLQSRRALARRVDAVGAAALAWARFVAAGRADGDPAPAWLTGEWIGRERTTHGRRARRHVAGPCCWRSRISPRITRETCVAPGDWRVALLPAMRWRPGDARAAEMLRRLLVLGWTVAVGVLLAACDRASRGRRAGMRSRPCG
jgi:hypothetical protein